MTLETNERLAERVGRAFARAMDLELRADVYPKSATQRTSAVASEPLAIAIVVAQSDPVEVLAGECSDAQALAEGLRRLQDEGHDLQSCEVVACSWPALWDIACGIRTGLYRDPQDVLRSSREKLSEGTG